MYRDDYDSRYDSRDAEDVYSKPVRAGKRTYFFDVKATKGRKDFYLTITESKRRTNPDGSFNYDKHKIFLYKEDFEKFSKGLANAISFIETGIEPEPVVPESEYHNADDDSKSNGFFDKEDEKSSYTIDDIDFKY